MSHLLNLGVEEEKVAMPSIAWCSKPLEKRLGSLASELQFVNEKMGSLPPGPGFDLYLGQHLAECVIIAWMEQSQQLKYWYSGILYIQPDSNCAFTKLIRY